MRLQWIALVCVRKDDSKTAQPPPQLVADSLRQVAWTNGEVDAPHGKLKQDLPILHWAFGVGCDFSGFFVEMLGMLRALQDRLPRFWADFGDCSPKMFGLLAQQVLSLFHGQRNCLCRRPLRGQGHTKLCFAMLPWPQYAFGGPTTHNIVCFSAVVALTCLLGTKGHIELCLMLPWGP